MDNIPTRHVVAAIIRRNNYIILGEKKNDPNINSHAGQWQLIGGGMKDGETEEDSLKREILEEVGLEITNIKKIRTSNERIENYKGQGVVNLIYHEFICDAPSGDIVISDEIKSKWVQISELDNYDICTPARDLIEISNLLDQVIPFHNIKPFC